ncbi:MAG: PAS domain S-box protein [Bdellovibrionota bacterium]
MIGANKHNDNLRSIIESVPNGLIIIDQTGTIVLSNTEVEKMFGYEKDELIGKKIEVLVPERFRAKHPELRSGFFHHPTKRQMGAGRDLAGLRKDNSEIPVEIGLNNMTSDDSVYVIAAIVDITERKKQEERLRTIVESVPSGIVMVNESGTIVLSNSELEKMFGYDPGELLEKKIEQLVPIRMRHHHPTLRQEFGQNPQKRQMGAGRDLTGQKKDGSEIPLEIGLNPIRTRDGNFVLASIVDITARKTIENKLHQVYEEIHQKNLEMEQFVYTVSHDLKAPLVSSMSFIGFLKEDLQANKMEDVFDSIDRLEKAHLKMQDLLADLLQLSRVGRLELQPEHISLNEVLNEIASYALDRLNSKRIKLEIPSNLPEITADKKRVHQVFENLISNAVKYGTSSVDPIIQILSKETETEIQICVKDNGTGIEKKYHHKIFGLFQRLHTDQEGTGVGLAIVLRIMQIHNGRVWVESEPGHGAEFWVSFPKGAMNV